MDAIEELGLAVVRNPARIGETVARVVAETGSALTRVAAS
jgi:hypothetical protein